MHRPLVASIALALAVLPPFVTAQDHCKKQFVVSQVNVPVETRLAADEQAAIRARLIGSCLDSGETGDLGRQVLVALHDLGYLGATVSEPSMTVFDAGRLPESVSIDVEFHEGTRYRVDEVDVVGNRVVPADQIISVSQIQLGDFLAMDKVQETADGIRRLYAANGFGKASVEPRVRLKEGRRVCVAFIIVEGPRSP